MIKVAVLEDANLAGDGSEALRSPFQEGALGRKVCSDTEFLDHLQKAGDALPANADNNEIQDLLFAPSHVQFFSSCTSIASLGQTSRQTPQRAQRSRST